MQVNYKKMIFTTIAYTLLVLVLIISIMMALMFFVFTKNCADFMYNIGNEKTAGRLYYKTYQKTGEILYCYKSLNININLANKDNVITLYEEFVADDEYENFISLITENNENVSAGILEKSAMLNEKDYLTNRYVRALVQDENFDKALDVSLEHFQDYKTWTFRNQGVYSLGELIEQNTFFNSKYEGFDGKLLSEVQNYFDIIVELFNTNIGVEDTLDKSYLMALGNRIVSVGQDINTLYENSSSHANLKESNEIRMLEVNNVIKGLL